VSVVAWLDQFETLADEWRSVAPTPAVVDMETWDNQFRSMAAHVADLRRRGLWRRGPTDLLSVCRVHRWELAQSAALAWVCDPEARHGLGTGVLAALLDATGRVPDLDGPTEVAVEASRARARADVVIRAPTCTLVIEVKVDATEGDEQCQRLYDDWHDEPDARFLFLTKRGKAPGTATTDEAKAAWTTMTWRTVAALLKTAVEAGDPAAAGRPAAQEWLRTITRLYGKASR
jgi:PD-(D/E)XK nuclease superfamily